MDGKAAVVNAHLATIAPDPPTGEWHVALFGLLRRHANSEGRVSAEWPCDRLLERRKMFAIPQDSSRTGIEREIRFVITSAEQAVGKEWVHQQVWHPLLAGVVSAPIPLDLLAPSGDLEDQVMTTWFREEYFNGRSRGLSMRHAYRAAARRISGHDVEDPTGDVAAGLRELEKAGPG
ncbi:MAG: hypothetical protein ACK5MT_00015 [Actinomycetales bacterium]